MTHIKKKEQQFEAEVQKWEEQRKLQEKQEQERKVQAAAEEARKEVAKKAAEEEEKQRKECERIEKAEEEAQQKAEAARIKQEKEEQTAKELAELAANLPFVVDLDKDDDVKLALPIPHVDPQIAESVKNISDLIADPDVLLGLQHLKSIGYAVRKQKETDVPKGLRNRNLFEALSPRQNKNSTASGDGDGLGLLIKQEPEDKNPFHSPPSKLFAGLKRHTHESFQESFGSSAKRRRTSTPGRGRVGLSPAMTPNRRPSSLEACVSVADTKSKCADAGDVFIQKKMTPANNSKLFDAVKAHKRDAIDYTENEDSFYKIMTYYCDGLVMVPEDVRHLKLKENFFNFVLRNTEYTQVNKYKCIFYI